MSKLIPAKFLVDPDPNDPYLYLEIDGVRIARREQQLGDGPKIWTSIEPGWRVFQGAGYALVEVEYDPPGLAS